MSTQLPDQCGIATYSDHLGRAGLLLGMDPVMVALDWGRVKSYSSGMIRMDVRNPRAHHLVARELMSRGVETVLIQFENGIFGGPRGPRGPIWNGGQWIDAPTGRQAVRLAEACQDRGLKVACTLHTLLPRTDDRRDVIKLLADACDLTIAMTRHSAGLLMEKSERGYGVDRSKVQIIPHGVMELGRQAEARAALGIPSDRFIFLIAGHMGPGKGVESALEALAPVMRANSEVFLYVVGKTHPGLLGEDGHDSLHEQWVAQAHSLGVSGQVVFRNEFIPPDDLPNWAAIGDVRLVLSSEKRQVVSGTLVEAVAAYDTVVVAAPFAHSLELLGRCGIIVQGPAELAAEVARLVDDPAYFAVRLATARACPPQLAWSEVVQLHLRVFEELRGGGPSLGLPVASGLPIVSNTALPTLTAWGEI